MSETSDQCPCGTCIDEVPFGCRFCCTIGDLDTIRGRSECLVKTNLFWNAVKLGLRAPIGSPMATRRRMVHLALRKSERTCGQYVEKYNNGGEYFQPACVYATIRRLFPDGGDEETTLKAARIDYESNVGSPLVEKFCSCSECLNQSDRPETDYCCQELDMSIEGCVTKTDQFRRAIEEARKMTDQHMHARKVLFNDKLFRESIIFKQCHTNRVTGSTKFIGYEPRCVQAELVRLLTKQESSSMKKKRPIDKTSPSYCTCGNCTGDPEEKSQFCCHFVDGLSPTGCFTDSDDFRQWIEDAKSEPESTAADNRKSKVYSKVAKAMVKCKGADGKVVVFSKPFHDGFLATKNSVSGRTIWPCPDCVVSRVRAAISDANDAAEGHTGYDGCYKKMKP